MSEEKRRCCKCGSYYEEEYYKYEDETFCFDCLCEELEENGRMHVVKTTHYYNDDWGELGTDDEINEVIQNISEGFDVEVI